MERRTLQRNAIEQAIIQAGHPMQVDEILAGGRETVPSLNLATVYRNLKMMVQKGWLRKISHPGLGTLYERDREGLHHHHFHCQVCGRVYELLGCPLKDGPPSPPGYVTEGHELYLFGKCPACAG